MNIGLITYHSAYNFGSILQAYATQEIVKELFGNCKVINYRTDEQKRVYAIFKWETGVKGFCKACIKNLLSLKEYRVKKNRQEKYERIIAELFDLTEEVGNFEEVKSIWNQFDVILSGSDQIWNKHSNELKYVDWEYMYPYVLRGYCGKKISYASSIVNMTTDEIGLIADDLRKFDAISFREYESYIKIKNEFGISCSYVLDPTFLIQRKKWIELLNLQMDIACDKYILFYALSKRSEIIKDLDILKKYAASKRLRIKMIAPLNFMGEIDGIEILKDTDPKDFMELIYNADTVITDSYHGTILSVNLEKNVFSICKGYPSDFRKVDILARLGLSERIIKQPEALLSREYEPIDYTVVNNKIQSLREESMNYLFNALKSTISDEN